VESSYAGGQAHFSVWGTSETGIQRVVATYTTGDGQWQSLDLAFNEATARWEGALPTTSPITYFVQAVDAEGGCGPGGQ